MEKLNFNKFDKKQLFVELGNITQNLFDIVCNKKIINVAPEILDEMGKLSDIVYNENKNECMEVMYGMPFEIGTYLKRKKYIVPIIDQVKKYVVKQDGIYAVLLLNALTDRAKESAEIPFENLLKEWEIANEKEIKHEEEVQRVLKY